MSLGGMALFAVVLTMVSLGRANQGTACEAVGNCTTDSSHAWGQYSPVFSVPSTIDASVPPGCNVTFAQILARHGARAPTKNKSDAYRAMIERIQRTVEDYGRGYDFLQDYDYSLGADDLTLFGEQQLVDSGVAFYLRYRDLAAESDPFVRASGSDRVIASAQRFVEGYYTAQGRNASSPTKGILVLPEQPGFNNTLDHGACPAFEGGPASGIRAESQRAWLDVFGPAINRRLNSRLPGANLTLAETIYMMDLCPFSTVATTTAALSDFCRLFSMDEWTSYDYFQSLDKWYGYGRGNPLGPSQGVGFGNELIARLTGTPVDDHTTTNSTLDSRPDTFPLNRKLYADFSHDNTMSSVFAALGLFNSTLDLPLKYKVSPRRLHGFSASWAVPFASRLYVEKMRCGASSGELVRVILNDRVVPLRACNSDRLGRCELSSFVNSLGFEIMVSTAGGVVIAIVVILVVAAVGWIVFTQLRARRLGLPPPSLSSYLPWHKSDAPYAPPRPARGGIVGWFNDLVRKFKHRNDRSAAGAYEQSLHSGGAPRGNRGFGPLDPDDAWDTRVGNEADGYGYYEQELGGHTEYTGASYNSNRLSTGPAAHAGYGEDVERGRRPSRDAGAATAAAAAHRSNPFDDDAQASLRGVSPRPMDMSGAGAGAGARKTGDRPDSSGSSHAERRSIFREDV
ncbi:3-phytase A [Trichoderma cornu-damae]|uniref:3-phytase n=1 Tax=Trichoderma cornu-damae TaxID=654480 RepID=A0A9P8QLZ7_9HYPO|nr:3-phytase A [Trichoderma cornu-damae]